MKFGDLIRPATALGFDGDRLKLLDHLVTGGITDRLYPSAVYVVMRHGMVAAHGAFGHAQPDAAPPVVTATDTVFDIASLTKSFTGTVLMQAIQRGEILLSQPVSSLFPEATTSPIAHVTVRQLATHTSGLPAWKPLYKLPAGEVVNDILHTPTENEPGTHYTYSDLGYILLGTILSKLGGAPLNELAHKQIFAPLGMKDTGYLPDRHLHSRIAATAHSRDRVGVTNVGVVHDENANGLGGVAGHAGIFSTAEDLCRFAISLQYASTASHFGLPQLLGAAARRVSQHSLIVDEKVGSHGVGWFIWPNPYLLIGDLLSPAAFGHTGFTGTMLLFEPQLDVTLILLTNRVYMATDGGGGIIRLRRQFANIALGAVND